MRSLSRKKILNSIIIFSLVGILIISLKNYVFSKNKQNHISTKIFPSPVLSNQTTTNDPEAPCVNRYINLSKGTVWRYKITSTVDFEGQKQQLSDFFTTSIFEASSTSILFETKYDIKKESVKMHVQCKKSGIYGIPFPVIAPAELSDFFETIRIFPPDQELKKNDSWQTTVDFGQSVSFPIPLSVLLYNLVVNKQIESFPYSENLTVIHIKTDAVFTDTMLKNFNDLTDELFNISFAEGVGMTVFNMDMNLEGVGRYKTAIQLVDFKR